VRHTADGCDQLFNRRHFGSVALPEPPKSDPPSGFGRGLFLGVLVAAVVGGILYFVLTPNPLHLSKASVPTGSASSSSLPQQRHPLHQRRFRPGSGPRSRLYSARRTGLRAASRICPLVPSRSQTRNARSTLTRSRVRRSVHTNLIARIGRRAVTTSCSSM